MKLRITILAAFALIAFDRVSAAEEPSQRLFRVADKVGIDRPLWPTRSPHRLAHQRSYSRYPVACEAVIFPRSPLCAGRPAAFGPYAPYPWNTFLYY